MTHYKLENILNEMIDRIVKEKNSKRKIDDLYDDGYWEYECPGEGCKEMIPYYRQLCGKYFCTNEPIKF